MTTIQLTSKAEVKFFEIHDYGVCYPVMCIYVNPRELNEAEKWLVVDKANQNCRPIIYMFNLTSSYVTWNPHDWNDKTYSVTHQYIIDHWDGLNTGSTVDARVARNEWKYPAESCRF